MAASVFPWRTCEVATFNVEIHVGGWAWECTCRLPKHTAQRAARYSKDEDTKDKEMEKEAQEDEESGPQIGTSRHGKAGRGVWKPASERAKKEAKKEGETSGGASILWIVPVRGSVRLCWCVCWCACAHICIRSSSCTREIVCMRLRACVRVRVRVCVSCVGMYTPNSESEWREWRRVVQTYLLVKQ
jgi:hypothetical protein